MISYKQLGLLTLAFIIGIITFLIFQNIINKEEIHLSTIDLIGFISSLVLSTASVVLAIVAISLGKSSEKIMIERNDKSIEQQSQIFSKTIEVMQRIESSTGVTEKRIEDIISGRAGQIADKLSSRNIRNRDKIEEEIKKSLSEDFTPEELFEQEKKKRGRDEAKTRYNKYHEELLLSFSNSDVINTLRLSGHGSYSEIGEKMFDGIFKVNEHKIGISIFSHEEYLDDMFIDGFPNFITNVTHALEEKLIEYFFYVSDKESEVSNKLKSDLDDATKLFRKDLKNKIFILTGDEDEIVKSILETVKNTEPNKS